MRMRGLVWIKIGAGFGSTQQGWLRPNVERTNDSLEGTSGYYQLSTITIAFRNSAD